MSSQNFQILQYLKSGKSLTPVDALRLFGCFRLSARIYDLKKDGHNIRSRRKGTLTGKHIAEYSLEK